MDLRLARAARQRSLMALSALVVLAQLHASAAASIGYAKWGHLSASG